MPVFRYYHCNFYRRATSQMDIFLVFEEVEIVQSSTVVGEGIFLCKLLMEVVFQE